VKVGLKKLLHYLADGTLRVILRSLVLTQYQHVTDRDTPPMTMSRSSIAERDKSRSTVAKVMPKITVVCFLTYSVFEGLN